MITKLYKILIGIFFVIFSLISINTVLAQTTSGSYNFISSSGLEKTSTEAGYSDTLKSLTPANTISKIIRIILQFLGVLFVGLMIYGGIVWMMAGGNEQDAEKAKNIIIAAIIGLMIVLAAYAISYFIVNSFSSSALQTN